MTESLAVAPYTYLMPSLLVGELHQERSKQLLTVEASIRQACDKLQVTCSPWWSQMSDLICIEIERVESKQIFNTVCPLLV